MSTPPTKKCPDCGGPPGLYPNDRCPLCHVKKQYEDSPSTNTDMLHTILQEYISVDFWTDEDMYQEAKSRIEDWLSQQQIAVLTSLKLPEKKQLDGVKYTDTSYIGGYNKCLDDIEEIRRQAIEEIKQS